MKQIQVWLGYSTFSTTADIYAHLDFSAQEQSAAAMSGMFQRKYVSKVKEATAKPAVAPMAGAPTLDASDSSLRGAGQQCDPSVPD